MSNKNLCPICGQGELHGRVELEESEYKGKVQKTPLYFSECDSCGSETATAEQTRRNKRVMIAFKKQVDGLLTGAENGSIERFLYSEEGRILLNKLNGVSHE